MRSVPVLHPVEMPAVDSNRPAVFLYYALNDAYDKSKPDPIALAELLLRHDPFSISPSPRSCANYPLQVIVHHLIEGESQ
jgi:hypothetical protein